MATGLLTAIAMDTGWFRHTNTRPGTLHAGAELIEAGADIADIYRQLFERNTLGRLRLMGQTLSGLQTDQGGRIAYAIIARDLERTGAIPQDSEDLVDFTVSLAEWRWASSSSSRLVAVSRHRCGRATAWTAPLAATLGGGGHRAAAGVTLAGSMAENVDRVLQAVRQALDPVTLSAQG